MRANVKRSTTARKQRANDVAFTVRFIADQIRELCMDNSGRMSYIEDMDDVMKDLTGVRSFAQRLVMSRTVEQFVNVVQQVGVAVVLDLLHDQNLFEAMRQMVLVSSRIRYLKKACKKVDRKLQECDRANPKREKYRKQLKDFAHEYKYLRKLYKRAILTMQSMLGVQTGTTFGDYEEQFSFLKSFADKGGRRRFDEFDFVDDFGLMDDPILDDIGGGHSYGRERRRGRNPIDELAGFGHDLRSNYRIEDMDEFVSVDDDDDDNYHGPDSDDLLSGINRLNANMDRMLTIMMSNGSFTPAKAPEPEPLIKDPNNASIGDLANAFNNFGSSIDRRMTKVEDQVVQMSNVIVSLKDDSDTVYTREELGQMSDPNDALAAQALSQAFYGDADTVEPEGDIPSDAEETAPYHPHRPDVPQVAKTQVAQAAAARDAGVLSTSREEVLSSQTDFEKSQQQ